ncbi:MAG: hypothetical protein ABIE47_01595 [Pseudomonadota bacterium]
MEKQPRLDQWEKNYKYFEGDQKVTGLHPHESPKSANLIQPLIRQDLSLMTTSRPKSIVEPRVNNDEAAQTAEFFNNIDPILWSELELQDVFSQALEYAEFCDNTSYVWNYFDRESNNALGGYVSEALDPFTCFHDPTCNTRNLNRDANYFFIVRKMSLPTIRRKYKARIDELRDQPPEEDGYESDQREEARFGVVSNVKDFLVDTYYKLIGSERVHWAGGNKSSDYKAANHFDLFTCFIRGEYLETEFKFWMKDSNGTGKLVSKKVKTPWRRIDFVGPIILSDSPVRTYDGRLPVWTMTTAPRSGSHYGVDSFKQLIMLQDLYNTLWSKMYAYIDKMINPDTWYSVNSVTEKDWWKKYWKRFRPVKGPASSAVYTDRPQNMGQDIIHLFERIPTLMREVINQPEVLAGIKPKGTRTKGELEQLTVNAAQPTSRKTIAFENGMRDVLVGSRSNYLLSLQWKTNKFMGGEIKEFYPQPFLEAQSMVETKIVEGSSMPNYGKMKQIAIKEFANAIQGMPPEMMGMMAEASEIPELRQMAKMMSQQVAPLDQAMGGGGGAVNIPLNQQEQLKGVAF